LESKSDEIMIEREMIIESSNFSGSFSLDVCFCVDITGSMSPMYKTCCTSIEQIVIQLGTELGKRFSGLEIIVRCAFVGYRDLTDSPQFQTYPFERMPIGDQNENVHQTNKNNLFQFMRSINPSGGGDVSEDVVGALNHVADLQWNLNSNVRMMILMCDAPGHTSELHNLPASSDKYHNRSMPQSLANVVTKLVKKKI
jgi:hypothetical protein